ncbi:MAG: hypothetical protein IPF58_16115 [Saprospirales bacterium]|nr:hypothetical protein [Saprospirales bacterium]
MPDKTIDLIDEAAAKLRLEMDSVPEELDVNWNENSYARNRARSYQKEK